jgi:hypothetical protein
MHIVWKVQNAVPALDHKTHFGCGDSMHYSHMGMKKSTTKRYWIWNICVKV